MLLEHPLGTGVPSVTTPMMPCIDGAGVVVEVGRDVRRFREGLTFYQTTIILQRQSFFFHSLSR